MFPLYRITQIASCNIPIPENAETLSYNPPDVVSIYTMDASSIVSDNIKSDVDDESDSIATGSIFDRSSKVDDMTIAETSCGNSDSADDSDNISENSDDIDDEVSI